MKRTKLLRLLSLLLTLTLLLCACKPTPPDNQGDEPNTQDPDINTPGTSDDKADDATPPEGYRVITEEEIRDRTAASWVAQMIGVAWAASTEFRFNNQIMPESQMPTWSPNMVNDAFGQDDLFVEVPFINAMKDHGIDCSMDIMGQYFADSTFWLAHANHIGRENIRNGIPASEAGHYENNWHADDIDWQIEADFLGNIYPGDPSAAAQRAFEIGHLMNYGDGVYGGVFVAAMHAAAFNATSLREIIDIGIESIPEGTKFRTVMDEVIDAYDSGMEWQALWQQLEDNWAFDDKCPECKGGMNIDAKLNAAYVLIGLLYGEGDFEKTILISTMCGQDSDCNPSTAAAVLGTYYGMEGIPEKYLSAVDYDNAVFAYTEYTLNDCIDINTALAVEYLNASAKYGDAWYIPESVSVKPVPFEQWPDDEITVYMTVTPKADGIVSVDMKYVAPDAINIKMDMGDGMVFDQWINSYRYYEAGTYTITCTVSDESGRSATVSRTVEVSGKRPFNITASSSNANPQGGGSRDPSVMCDGAVDTVDLAMQYDTYPGTAGSETWFALNFDRKVTVSKIFFTEGTHFENGGWFIKAPVAELLINGEWVACEYDFSPLYIEVNSMSAQGNPFETFTYTLKTPTKCDGIRIKGTAGGSSSFASCAELDVAYTEVENPINGEEMTGDIVADAIPLVSVAAPGGAGNKDIEIMRDGYIPKQGEHHGDVQYDTFTGDMNDHEDFFGYMFRYDCRVTSITYTEGSHFDNGGWFKNGEIRVEALINDAWVEVEAICSPTYPKGDSQGTFGSNFNTYTFTLAQETVCRGIRVIGAAGGSAHFTSVSELSVEGERVQ